MTMSIEPLDDPWLDPDGVVGPTSLGPGWQPEGFHACLDPGVSAPSSNVVSCIVNLGVIGFGGAAYQKHLVHPTQSHETCPSDGSSGGKSAYSLFEFGRIPQKLAGFISPFMGGLLGQIGAGVFDSWSNTLYHKVYEDATSHAIALALARKIQRARENMERYRP